MPKSLICPLFNLFFYSHTPEEYEWLREKYKKRFIESLGDYNSQKYFLENERGKHSLLEILEEKYPTPLYWNDIAGFIAIRVENPVGAYKIVAEVWSIKNRKFTADRALKCRFGVDRVLPKNLLDNHKKFNALFFQKVEEALDEINKRYLKPKRFYFSLKDNRIHWGLTKSMNVTALLNKLGKNWIY